MQRSLLIQFSVELKNFCFWLVDTELDREKTDFPPYLNCHGQKIGSSRVLLATCSKVADCVCAALQVWSGQHGRNISALKVAQSYSVSLRKDPTRPNFCSIADGAIIHGGIGSLCSPYVILCLWVRCSEWQRPCSQYWSRQHLTAHLTLGIMGEQCYAVH